MSADRGWLLAQTLEDLLFAHWRVPAAALRPHVAPELEIETRDGAAWLTVAAFRATGIRARGLPALPVVSTYLGVNVRTYVQGPRGAGVWFFSLDASSRLAVEAARRLYGLPFFHARMSRRRRGDWIDVECARAAEPGRVFSARYRAAGGLLEAAPESLETFLTARDALYARVRGRLRRAAISHEPWPLQPAEAEIALASIAPVAVEGEPVCHVARRQHLRIWPLEPVA